MSESLNPVCPEAIATMVHWIRHKKVMLDSDLAGFTASSASF
jgi:hypothetical protein